MPKFQDRLRFSSTYLAILQDFWGFFGGFVNFAIINLMGLS